MFQLYLGTIIELTINVQDDDENDEVFLELTDLTLPFQLNTTSIKPCTDNCTTKTVNQTITPLALNKSLNFTAQPEYNVTIIAYNAKNRNICGQRRPRERCPMISGVIKVEKVMESTTVTPNETTTTVPIGDDEFHGDMDSLPWWSIILIITIPLVISIIITWSYTRRSHNLHQQENEQELQSASYEVGTIRDLK